ncbi:MAG: hypothetical protein OXI15_03500 [Chromatiales bacterium]|nr:hypothetical protein [Chromatiales bacterium]
MALSDWLRGPMDGADAAPAAPVTIPAPEDSASVDAIAGELRSAGEGGYTDSITAAFESAAEGAGGRNPLRTAALEAAVSLYASCLAAAVVEPASMRDALTAPVRALLARNLVRRGESFHAIRVRRGRVVLEPIGYATVHGAGPDPMRWRYEATLYGPTDSVSQWLAGAAVLHPRWSVDASRPWQGVAPWAWAGDTGGASGGAEAMLQRETGATTGYVVPLPHGVLNSGQIGDSGGVSIREAMRLLGGRTAFMPSAKNVELGAARSQEDWQQKRLGAAPAETLLRLRSDAGMAVLAACGVPSALVDPGADGAGSREAWRRFAAGPLRGFAALIEHECALKLDVDVQFDFEVLRAHDVVARATAFRRMVEGGMDLPAAAAASGVLAE